MKKACAILLLILLALTLFFACAKEEPAPSATPAPVPTATPTPEPEEPVIAAVMAGDGAFAQATAAALEPQVAAAGYRLLPFFPATAADQENDVYSAIGSGAECIILQPVDPDSLQLVMEECAVQGIPVIGLLDQVNGTVASLVAPDYKEVGALAARAAADAQPTGATVLMAEGGNSAFVTQMMRDGFFAQTQEMDDVSLVASVLVDEQQADTFDKVSVGLSEYPDANVVFAAGEALAAEAVRAARESGRDVAVLTVGGSGEVMQMVADGQVFASVLVSPAQLAGLAGEFALYAVGAQVGDIATYAQLKPEVITKENVAEYQAKGAYADILAYPTPSPPAGGTEFVPLEPLETESGEEAETEA